MRLIALLLPGLLAACANTVLPVTYGRITTEAEFVATAVGRTVSNANTSIAITRNGRITGVTHGNEISGTWEWRDGFWCRTITAPVQTAEDCQVWEVRNGVLRITRDRGTGETLEFRPPAPADR